MLPQGPIEVKKYYKYCQGWYPFSFYLMQNSILIWKLHICIIGYMILYYWQIWLHVCKQNHIIMIEKDSKKQNTKASQTCHVGEYRLLTARKTCLMLCSLNVCKLSKCASRWLRSCYQLFWFACGGVCFLMWPWTKKYLNLNCVRSKVLCGEILWIMEMEIINSYLNI